MWVDHSSATPQTLRQFSNEKQRIMQAVTTRFGIVSGTAAMAMAAFWLTLLAIVCGNGIGSRPAWGQFPQITFPEDVDTADQAEPIMLSARFQVDTDGTSARLHVDAVLSGRWHVYSVTQPPGGPLRTEITVDPPSGVRLAGTFVPDSDPQRSQTPDFPGVTIEEHESQVRWTAPLKLAPGTTPDAISINLNVRGLVCQTDGSCLPFEQELVAKFDGKFESANAASSFRDGTYPIQWQGELRPGTVEAGERFRLLLTATPQGSYHVYPAAVDDSPMSTNFVLTRRHSLQPGLPNPSEPPVTIDGPSGEATYQKGEVTWTIDFQVPKDMAPGEYPLEGFIAYQACTDTSCLLPKALRFKTTLRVDSQAGTQTTPVHFEVAKRADVLDQLEVHPWQEASVTTALKTDERGSGDGARYSLVMMVAMAFAAGLILNLMPCVLPVLGLKLMSITEQAGQNRRELLASNLAYSLGVLTVFWVLAIGVSLFSFGWGEQFTYIEFKLTLTVLVFAMALSFLGVWELPVPGFASGKASQELQKQEGFSGSFFKGLFTTVIATPCGGPLLGLVLSLLLGQPASLVFAIFTAMGIGMAFPFLLIGISPRLASWLPKPGAWMDTLKQLLAFVLLGTVAFFLSTFSKDYHLPVFILLIGVWFACWWIGRVPSWESLPKRLTAWSGGIVTATIIGVLAFRLLVPANIETVVAWEPFDEARLTQLQAEGKTVMIDFTADWCLTCKWNYHTAINTQPTKEMLRSLEAVPMLADWTDHNERIKQKLLELETQSIPLLAIYPGNAPDRPIILRDLVSQADVLKALQAAGPSQNASESEVASRPLVPAVTQTSTGH